MTEQSVVPSIFRLTDRISFSRGSSFSRSSFSRGFRFRGLCFLGDLRFRGLRFLGGLRFRGLCFLGGLRFLEGLCFRGVFGLRSSLSRHPLSSP